MIFVVSRLLFFKIFLWPSKKYKVTLSEIQDILCKEADKITI